MSWVEALIRLDDRRNGRATWVFNDPVSTGRASALDEVVAALDAADARARIRDEWVVVAVAYEAAPAFDPAMRTAHEPPEGVPYVWWQSFRELATEPVQASSPVQVTTARRANAHPYPEAVDLVRGRIAAGDLYQANISDRFDGTFEGSPLAFYESLLAAQSCEFGAYLEMDDLVVASASPELFFDWRGDTITCRPMKGTATRHPRAEHDAAAARSLQHSVKDRAENVMIVDLVRNDLGRIAQTGTVEVPHLFDLERYETVWQLTSTVEAKLHHRTTLVDTFAALFPCGSVTGAPKIAAMATISELEAEPRGIYCGAIGVLTPRHHEHRAVFSVPIRTAVIDPATSSFVYGAGAGITWSSDPLAEDHEVEAKTRILTSARPAQSLFETLRLDEDGLRNASLHVERLTASAHWFGFANVAPDDIRGRLEALEPPTCSRVVRVRVVLDTQGDVAITQESLNPAPPGSVRLAIDDVTTLSTDVLCCHKTTKRGHYDQARARHPHVDDVILVNERGHVIETTIANLAIHADGRWWCPPLDDGGLAGIARHVALERNVLAERSFTTDEIRAGARIAVLNDLRGWRDAIVVQTSK